jgi:hypothetical protein
MWNERRCRENRTGLTGLPLACTATPRRDRLRVTDSALSRPPSR